MIRANAFIVEPGEEWSMSGVPKKLLLVDDEAIITFHLESILTAAGYKVVGTAATGLSAVELAEKTQPDLVLMDIVYP